jgi:hypothetical protein
MDLNNDSSIPQLDKMAMPNYSGKPFSRPEWEPAPRQRRGSKPAPQAKHATSSKLGGAQAEKNTTSGVKMDFSTGRSQAARATRDVEARSSAASVNERHDQKETKVTSVQSSAKADTVSQPSPTDLKFDLSKITAHHAEGSAQVKKDRVEMPPADRKEQARKRLEERKRLRKNSPA